MEMTIDMRIIFVHGWGLAPDFWKEVIPFFPEYECLCINLGFLGNEQKNIPISQNQNRDIYVTHSLGTLWTIRNCSENMCSLIAINGFTTFRRFASKEILTEMKSDLLKSPKAHMKDFWNKICIQDSQETLNIDMLANGLDWLAEWNEKAHLKTLNIPVLALAGRQDKILPLPQMQKEWSRYDMHVHNNGGHILPKTHASWCAQQIKDFLP